MYKGVVSDYQVRIEEKQIICDKWLIVLECMVSVETGDFHVDYSWTYEYSIKILSFSNILVTIIYTTLIFVDL